MMCRFRLVLFFLTVSNFGFSQDIKTTWFFDQNTYFKFENTKAHSESFDFIQAFETHGDTLVIKNGYDSTTRSCYRTDEKGELIKTRCEGELLPDSEFLISKLTKDSLFIIPINNSAKAISAKLRFPFFGDIDSIAKNPEAEKIVYYRLIRLYSASTLNEKISWDTLTFSSSSTGYFGAYYFDLRIVNSGKFFAIERYIPFEEKKPTKDHKTKITYYEDNLSRDFLQMINSELNKSGIKRLDTIRFKGWTSHGSYITLKVVMVDQTKLLTAADYCFPYSLKQLLALVSDLTSRKRFKKTGNRFKIETSYYNRKDE